MNNTENNPITFEIVKHLGVIETHDSGWSKELNLVSWNGQPPKYDIRDWNKDNTRMSKGITLHEQEMQAIVEFYLADPK